MEGLVHATTNEPHGGKDLAKEREEQVFCS